MSGYDPAAGVVRTWDDDQAEIERLREASRMAQAALEAPYGENGVIPQHIQRACQILDEARNA